MHKAILKIPKIIIPVLAKILNFFHKLQCLYFLNRAVDFIWGLISRRGPNYTYNVHFDIKQ